MPDSMDRHPTDALLRRAGFTIADRPRKGPVWWWPPKELTEHLPFQPDKIPQSEAVERVAGVPVLCREVQPAVD